MAIIGIRDQFCLGGMTSVAGIFSPLLAENQVVLPKYYVFLPENGYLKNSRAATAPPPRTPMMAICIMEIVMLHEINFYFSDSTSYFSLMFQNICLKLTFACPKKSGVSIQGGPINTKRHTSNNKYMNATTSISV